MSRPCVERKSKKNPDSYSKDELVNLAIKTLDISKTEANKLSKQELCIELKLIPALRSERVIRGKIHKISKKINKNFEEEKHVFEKEIPKEEKHIFEKEIPKKEILKKENHDLEKVTFPNIDLSLDLRIKKICLQETSLKDILSTMKKEKINCIDYYKPEDLYKLIYPIKYNEIGGEYDMEKGYIIDPRVSYYDKKSNRPYVTLNINAKSGIVWHSHPFEEKGNNYPSIEDLDMIRIHPHLISLIVTTKGTYVLAMLKPYVSINLLIMFYNSIQDKSTSCGYWNHDELEKNFIQNKGYTKEHQNKYDIYVRLVTIPYALDINLINDEIKRIHRYRNEV